MVMKSKPKNNNLAKHKEVLQKRNKALVERAISHIESLGGVITMSMVSKVTYEIANPENKEKGITLAGISKNPIYRELIEYAKASSEQKQGLNHHTKTNSYSDGDIRMMLHALRVENETLKRKNKIISQHLKESSYVIEKTEPIEETLIQEYKQMKDVARSLVSRLCELELTYIDAETETLRVFHYDESIVPPEALKLFYSKELNEIQSKIRKDAPYD